MDSILRHIRTKDILGVNHELIQINKRDSSDLLCKDLRRKIKEIRPNLIDQVERYDVFGRYFRLTSCSCLRGVDYLYGTDLGRVSSVKVRLCILEGGCRSCSSSHCCRGPVQKICTAGRRGTLGRYVLYLAGPSLDHSAKSLNGSLATP